MTLDKLNLAGTWELKMISGPAGSDGRIMDCEVPGNIETALHRAGLAGDPYYGMNALEYRRFEFCDWVLSRSFEYRPAGKRVELVFDGLEPFTEIRLNDHVVGEVKNGLIPHRFRVENVLRPGENRLEVWIRSCVNSLRNVVLDPSVISVYPFNYESLFVRKPAHVWGWDIAPRFAVGGIWRGVRLEELPEHRFADVCLQTLSADAAHAELACHYTFETSFPDYAGMELLISGRCGESSFEKRVPVWLHCGFVRLEVENPQLWQPRNYGTPALYEVAIRLLKEGAPVAERNVRLGIRTVVLQRNEIVTAGPDCDFAFWVNGRRIHVQGTNHVPADALHGNDSARLPRLLDMLKDLNCNMVRVWGGGVYESDEFYDFCDEAGILVWQDFMMGCAVYPRDETFLDLLAAEAESVIKRLRQHPSLALWAGDNECDAFAVWSRLGVEPGQTAATRKRLPEILRRLDPMRPYLPSSPYFSEAKPKLAGEDSQAACPEKHLWGPRNYFRSNYYARPDASFISEIGYHGCPGVDSLRRFLPPERLWPYTGNPAWQLHGSNPYFSTDDMLNYRTELMGRQIVELFGEMPDGLDDFAAASQICQAEALKFFIETIRTHRPKTSGILWWNLADCWPQFSDAVVDYYWNRKLAYYYIRRIQQPLCVMIAESDDWRRSIILDNASSESFSGEWRVRDGGGDGNVAASGRFTVNPNAMIVLGQLPNVASARNLYLLEWKIDGGTGGVNHYLAGPPPFSLARYSQVFLPAIAALDHAFRPGEVGK